MNTAGTRSGRILSQVSLSAKKCMERSFGNFLFYNIVIRDSTAVISVVVISVSPTHSLAIVL